MRRLLALVPLVAACHSNGQENLGLGRAKAAIDVSRLAQPDELARALSLSGPDLDARLGAHKMDAFASTKVELANRASETLEDTFVVQADGAGGVHLVHDNSRGNGFEAFAVDGQLYVKPRYGRFVKRKPEGDDLERLRSAAETSAAAYLRLLGPWLQVREAGAAQVAGHSGVKLALSARNAPAAADLDDAPGHAWRKTLQVRYIDGDVVVDAKNGAPLEVRLEAAYTFQRDGQPVQATVHFKQLTTAGGPSLSAPSDWTTLGRPRPLLDEQQLLEGLK